MYTTIVVVIDI